MTLPAPMPPARRPHLADALAAIIRAHQLWRTVDAPSERRRRVGGDTGHAPRPAAVEVSR